MGVGEIALLRAPAPPPAPLPAARQGPLSPPSKGGGALDRPFAPVGRTSGDARPPARDESRLEEATGPEAALPGAGGLLWARNGALKAAQAHRAVAASSSSSLAGAAVAASDRGMREAVDGKGRTNSPTNSTGSTRESASGAPSALANLDDDRHPSEEHQL